MKGTFYLTFGEFGICHIVRNAPHPGYSPTDCGKNSITAMYCSYRKSDIDGYGSCKKCFPVKSLPVSQALKRMDWMF